LALLQNAGQLRWGATSGMLFAQDMTPIAGQARRFSFFCASPDRITKGGGVASDAAAR